MAGRSGSNKREAWWMNTLRTLRPELRAYMGRRLEGSRAAEAAAAVEETIAEKASNREFSQGHADWFGLTEPAIQSQIEFKRFVWHVARMRRLDGLRHQYLLHLDAELLDVPDATNEANRLEAREILRAIARELENMPSADRELLMRAASTRESQALTGAERVQLHRLREALAERVLGKVTTQRSQKR